MGKLAILQIAATFIIANANTDIDFLFIVIIPLIFLLKYGFFLFELQIFFILGLLKAKDI